MSNVWGIISGVLMGLAVNETCDLSPWLAQRIVPVAARLWTRDPERREVYTEAWLAIINDRPGKLFKLTTALAFLGAGATASIRHRLTGLMTTISLLVEQKLPTYYAAFGLLKLAVRRSSPGQLAVAGISSAAVGLAVVVFSGFVGLSDQPLGVVWSLAYLLAVTFVQAGLLYVIGRLELARTCASSETDGRVEEPRLTRSAPACSWQGRFCSMSAKSERRHSVAYSPSMARSMRCRADSSCPTMHFA
ncbi:hypothetical protein KZZ52_56640 [Dactylosporangium sp. AC04546]|uniref:hypothetical protein n=1 Tax=Dactylosporangium sp. AC04546 TaxID=2862460 RepID=UPI001EE0BDCF|nr:hypothetical protein [Dactylosporangium sp. AC04546]WVK83241.1 hypothetical protein KZZ52_56640 [Dactylosporangium sp. AC04546]